MSHRVSSNWHFNAARYVFCLCIAATSVERASASDPLSHLTEEERKNIHIFQTVSNAVVNIRTSKLQRDLLSYDVSEIPAGNGSGFLWDKRGHIVTNFHVIKGSNKVSVALKNGQTLKAKVIGIHPPKDLAVLKVDLPADFNAVPVEVANSSLLMVGQKSIAIGSPFGLDQTMTEGIVSALGRSIPGIGGVRINDMIQTDASINPGNSGGPLLDSSGKLIGVNTLIFSESGSSAGVGFAVPSMTVKRIANQLIRFGRVRQPGIGIAAFPKNISDRLGIPGVLIRSVFKNTPAARAGLRGTFYDTRGELHLGDLITAVDGTQIQDFDDFFNLLDQKNIGDTIKIMILRDNRKQQVAIKLIDIGPE